MRVALNLTVVVGLLPGCTRPPAPSEPAETRVAPPGTGSAPAGDESESQPVQPEPVGGPDSSQSFGDGLGPGVALFGPVVPSDYGSLAFSPDGKLLAATRDNHPVLYVWETATGKRVAELPVDRRFTGGVAFSPDGTSVAVATAVRERVEGTEEDVVELHPSVVVWEVPSWKRKAVLRWGEVSLVGLAFSGDGALLAVGHDVVVWDVARGKPGQRLEDAEFGESEVAISRDGSTVAAVRFNGEVRVWDVRSGKLRARLKTGGDRVSAIDLDSSGGELLAVGRDGALTHWKLSGMEGELLRRLVLGPNWGAAFSPDRRLVVTAGDKGADLWDVATGVRVAEFSRHSSPVRAVVFSPDGRMVASGSRERGVKIDRVPPRPAK